MSTSQTDSGWSRRPAIRPGLASSASAAAPAGQDEDEPGGEARLGRRGAGVASDPVGGLQRGGLAAQEPHEVAARVALQEDPGDDRVPRRVGGAAAEGLERVGCRLAERERAGGGAGSWPAAPSSPSAATAIAPRIECPAATASASAAPPRRRPCRRLRVMAAPRAPAATTSAGPRTAASAPSATPPISQPAAASAPVASSASRRRSGPVGARPSWAARTSGSSACSSAATRERSTAASASHAQHAGTPAPNDRTAAQVMPGARRAAA